ncbi:prepilin-type N-terminal cleavage/methylation domain-containing protein [Patescibacteria group bacterium]|nr:prepilin-type N-terminal cleavage/methylation domain-containing protein [Patescibacteria group bacterium]
MKQHGFTLLELVVVVVAIIILLAIVFLVQLQGV